MPGRVEFVCALEVAFTAPERLLTLACGATLASLP
jgi:hypothetical protein